MKASLDTNAIIHFYRAGLQHILFDFFNEGVFIYEQIRDIELYHHGKDILPDIDADINSGKITLYTDNTLKSLSVFKLFEFHVKENKNLYNPEDLGEIYAISLAQTLGAYSLVTDDIKQGGPYMSLLQFEDEIMPFTFADILILRYLFGNADARETISAFDSINTSSSLNWSFNSQLAKFIKRFWVEPYKISDTIWMDRLVRHYNIKVKQKLTKLKNSNHPEQ